MPVIVQASLTLHGRQYALDERLHEAPSARADTAEGIRQLVTPMLQDAATEKAVAVYLGCAGDVIAASVVASGDSRSVPFTPELFVRPAMLYVGVCAIITGHNHLVGRAAPSQADLAAFDRLKDTFELFGWEYRDNFIWTATGFYSFREEGHFGPVTGPGDKPKRRRAVDAAPIHANSA